MSDLRILKTITEKYELKWNQMTTSLKKTKQRGKKIFPKDSYHFQSFHSSPSVLEVDVGSVFEREIRLDFAPVALAKLFNSFF